MNSTLDTTIDTGEYASVSQEQKICRSVVRERAVRRVIAEMHARLQYPLSQDSLAEAACFSRFHFSRVFKEMTGLPPAQFLSALRLERAKYLLGTSNVSVTEICTEVGYNSLGTFVSRFSCAVGLPPRKFRQLISMLGDVQASGMQERIARSVSTQACSRRLQGVFRVPASFSGPVFLGIYDGSLPEGVPVQCALLAQPEPFEFDLAFPNPACTLFAAGIPSNANVEELLTLRHSLFAKSRIPPEHSSGHRLEITLSSRSPFNPPLLSALPLMAFLSGR